MRGRTDVSSEYQERSVRTPPFRTLLHELVAQVGVAGVESGPKHARGRRNDEFVRRRVDASLLIALDTVVLEHVRVPEQHLRCVNLIGGRLEISRFVHGLGDFGRGGGRRRRCCCCRCRSARRRELACCCANGP